MGLSDIEKMTPQERLRTLEALWDAMTHELAEPASPTWHEEILQARRSRIETGRASFIPLADVKSGRRG